ncbi:hypothetical protein GCM10010970_29520 [Silvimonas iriomotensis]|uniref:Uncharacterized protein n=1 Tax=Silvimonas iriomotensis TaxID=449662 RepID=A0ABQ2PBW4_9NEIS|nr:hypothetical protein GCM10010970_29520 [Silvimonas iriomotensis]
MYNRLPCAGQQTAQPYRGPLCFDVPGPQRYDFLPKQALSDSLSLIVATGALFPPGRLHRH